MPTAPTGGITWSISIDDIEIVFKNPEINPNNKLILSLLAISIDNIEIVSKNPFKNPEINPNPFLDTIDIIEIVSKYPFKNPLIDPNPFLD